MEFHETLKKMFTSYDGFMSFYSNDPDGDEWTKPVEKWDHNQLQALIRAYVIKEVNSDTDQFRNSLEEDLYEEAQHVCDPLPEVKVK